MESEYANAIRFGVAAILNSTPNAEVVTRVVNEVQRINAQGYNRNKAALLLKSNCYRINDRKGVYELTTADGKSHCFHMSDTLKYEYFPIDSNIVELKHSTRFHHDKYTCSCGFETTRESEFTEHLDSAL